MWPVFLVGRSTGYRRISLHLRHLLTFAFSQGLLWRWHAPRLGPLLQWLRQADHTPTLQQGAADLCARPRLSGRPTATAADGIPATAIHESAATAAVYLAVRTGHSGAMSREDGQRRPEAAHLDNCVPGVWCTMRKVQRLRDVF